MRSGLHLFAISAAGHALIPSHSHVQMAHECAPDTCNLARAFHNFVGDVTPLQAGSTFRPHCLRATSRQPSRSAAWQPPNHQVNPTAFLIASSNA